MATIKSLFFYKNPKFILRDTIAGKILNDGKNAKKYAYERLLAKTRRLCGF